jgi:hypothetical protein
MADSVVPPRRGSAAGPASSGAGPAPDGKVQGSPPFCAFRSRDVGRATAPKQRNRRSSRRRAGSRTGAGPDDQRDAARRLARLRAIDIPLDHIGGSTAHRRSAYVVIEPEGLQIELVAYDSAVPEQRNVYEA